MGNQFLNEDDRLQRPQSRPTPAPQGDEHAEQHQETTMREAGRDYTRQLGGGEAQELVCRTPAGTPAGVEQGRLLQQAFQRGKSDGAELAKQFEQEAEAEQKQAEGEQKGDGQKQPQQKVVEQKGAEMQRLDALGKEPPLEQKGGEQKLPMGPGEQKGGQKGLDAKGQKGQKQAQKGEQKGGPEQKAEEAATAPQAPQAPAGPAGPMTRFDQLVLEDVMAAGQTEQHDPTVAPTTQVAEQTATAGEKQSPGFGAQVVSAMKQAVLGPISSDWRQSRVKQFDNIWGQKSIYGEGNIATLQKTIATVRMVVDSVGSIAGTVGLWSSLLSLVGLIPGLQPIGAFLAAVGEVCTIIGIACAAINIALSALNMVISLVRLIYEKLAGVDSGAQFGAMFLDDLFNIGASVISIGLSSAGGSLRAGVAGGRAAKEGGTSVVGGFFKGMRDQVGKTVARNLVRTGLPGMKQVAVRTVGQRLGEAGIKDAGKGTLLSVRDMWRTMYNDQAQRWAKTAVARGLIQKGGASETLAKAGKSDISDEMLAAWREENRQVRQILGTEFKATGSTVVRPEGGGMPYRDYSGHVSPTGETTEAAAQRLQQMVPGARPTVSAGPGSGSYTQAVNDPTNVVKANAGGAIRDALVQGASPGATTSDMVGNAYSRWIRSVGLRTVSRTAERDLQKSLQGDNATHHEGAPADRPQPQPAPAPAPTAATGALTMPTNLTAALASMGGGGGGGGDVVASVTARSETAGQTVASNIFAPEAFTGPDTALPPDKGPVALEALEQVKGQREALLEMQKGLAGRREEAKVAIAEAKETSALGGKWTDFGKGVQGDAAGMKQKYAQKGTELGNDAVKAGEGAQKSDEVKSKATGMSEKASGTQGKGNAQPAQFPSNPSLWQRMKRFFLEGVVGRFNAAMERGKQILTNIITKAVMGAMNMDAFKAKVVEGKEKAVKGQQEMKTSEDRMAKGEQKAIAIQKEGAEVKAEADAKHAESVKLDQEYAQSQADVQRQLAALDAREATLTAKAQEFKGQHRQTVDSTNAEIQKVNAGVGLEERSTATVDADVQAIGESVAEVQQASQRAVAEVRATLARVAGAARQDVDAVAQGKGGQVEQTGTSLAQRHAQMEQERAGRVQQIAAEAQGMAGQRPTPERTRRLGELHRQLAQEARGVEQTKQSILAAARQEYGALLEDLQSAARPKTQK